MPPFNHMDTPIMPLTALENEILDGMRQRRPDLAAAVPALLALHDRLVALYDSGGTLFTCGNGGSCGDAIHIVGELGKSFERKRPVPAGLAAKLAGLPFGDELALHLEAGLRAHTLGLNAALKTAIENDSPCRDIAFAQELNALVRPGDVLLALSTSGNADNCRMAMSTAKAHGATAAVFTGPAGGAMAREADIAVHAPGATTKEIQEAHIVLWHTMCLLIEAHYFPELR